MQVRVDGLVWLPLEGLTYQNQINIKEQLTVYPRKTTDIGNKADPPPIFLFEEKDEHLGVPRGWYLQNITAAHEEILDVSYGGKMQDLKTRYRSDGHFVEQEAVLRMFEHQMENRKWGGFLLQAGCAFGKALAHGEPVLTPVGYVPVERIEEGDDVAGTDGLFHRVSGVYPQGERECYRVMFTDGTHVDCDGDHLWTFEKRRSRGRVVTLDTEELARSKRRGRSGRVFWLPEQRPVGFGGHESLPLDPYTMGAIIGDGSIAGGAVYFYSEDDEIVDNLRMPEGCHVVERKGGNSGKAKTYTVISEERENRLNLILRSMSMMGHLSTEKWIPKLYRFSSIDSRVALLQGIFDTDGSPISSGLVEYTTSSRDLAHNVKFVVETLAGTCVMSKRETFYTDRNGERVGPFDSFRLTVKLPRDIVPFRLQRKRRVTEAAAWQRRIGRAVESVVSIGKRQATCLSVESDDKLFLTRGCVPTHNTSTALELARRLGRRTLILVHKEFFLEQWKDRIEYLMPDARVGLIQQKKCEHEDVDFSIGMLQSLARDDGERYPKKLYDAFGTILSDETHRTAADSWSNIIPRFNAAWRVGLTATPRRKDGAQNVFFYHISDISYSAETKPQVPKLRILRTHSSLKPIRRGRYRVDVQDLNSAQVLSQLGADEFRAKDIVDQLVLAVKAGRKTMVVSERISHLKMMADMLGSSLFELDLPFVPVIDFYVGEWYSGEVWDKTTKSHRRGDPKMAKRKQGDLRKAESANVIFATKQICEEGLDVQALDVIVLSTPMGDVEQMVGRVRRWCEEEPAKCKRLCPWRAGECKEKPTPIVVDVVDEIDKLKPKWERRKRFYRSIGTMKKGEG